MIISKKFIALALVSTIVPFAAFAENVAPAQAAVPAPSKAVVLGNKLWASAKSALQNAKIKKQLSIPTVELAKGFNLGASYQYESSASIGGKYSGIDVWDVNLSAYPQLFDVTLPAGVGAAATISRQVTYIQQFATQKESVMRVPYDPITKLPLNAKLFFEKHKNIFTGEEEQILKPGDFIGYRAPMTFSLGKGFNQVAAGYFGVTAGLSYAISGEFDVHIFVMDNNLVRVKILAAKSNTKGVSVGLNLLGFNGIGNLIVSKLVDTQILEAYMNSSNSDLFIADYVFNMSKDDSKDVYNRIIGSKLHVFSIEAIKQQILAANPFADDESNRNRLLANLDDLNVMAAVDSAKPKEERRIYKLLNAHNATESSANGQKLSLFRILKYQNVETKSGSKITIYANNDNSIKEKFRLDGYNMVNSFEILPALNIWGDNHTSANSLLTQTDLNSKPVDFIGLQNSTVREDLSLKKEEFDGLLNRLQKILPASIFNKLDKPNWNFGSKQEVASAHIQQDITFNSNLFKMKTAISQDAIKTALNEIIQHFGKFKSKPMAAQSTSNSGEVHPSMQAYNSGKYAEAYEGWETYLIPQKLAVVLNSGYSFDDRYAEFSYLYEKVPLFQEISNVLLLKLLPESELEKVVIVRFMMSAKNQTTLISDYPNTESFNTSNLFREILAQNAFISDQTYNLRNYIKENGAQYTIDEILIEKK